MRTVLLPPGVNPIAVKYIIYLRYRNGCRNAPQCYVVILCESISISFNVINTTIYQFGGRLIL